MTHRRIHLVPLWRIICRGGQKPFFKSANCLGSFCSCKSAKFVKCASPQIANMQVFVINPQISTNTAQLCLNTVLKDGFKTMFKFVLIWLRELYAIFVRRKSMYLRTCGRFKSAKSLVPQITRKYWVRKSHTNKNNTLDKKIFQQSGTVV